MRSFLFVVLCLSSSALSGDSQLVHRADPIMVPIHLHSRGLLVNASNHTSHTGATQLAAASGVPAEAGITPVAWTSDRQSYYTMIQISDIFFRVALDTASSDLWIVSTACQSPTCKTVPKYPLLYESPTFVSVANNATPYQVSYQDGTAASGFIAIESVQLANLTSPRQAFGMVTNCNVSFTDELSGIMGLGFPRLSSIPSSVTNSTPFFANLAQQGLLDYPLFGVSLTRNASGSLTIGAIDASVVKNVSQINWNKVVEFPPINTESHSSSYLQWAISLSGFSVGGTRLKPQPTYPSITKNQSYALFDIGTSGIYGSYADVSRLFALVDDARLVDESAGSQWVVPCDTTTTISLLFGNHEYILQPTDYLIGPASGNPNLCLAWPRATAPSPDGIDWQIGTAFLRTVYTVFSFGINTKEPPMIGLYSLSNGTNMTETAAAVSSFLSLESATIATTLPNVILPTPTYAIPSYIFNSSIPAPVGGIVSSGLATSTYSPILGHNVTALPTISPSPTLMTLTFTNSIGRLTTSVSTEAVAEATLGVPPGWNGCGTLRPPGFFAMVTLYSVFIWTLFYVLNFASW
ncbi:hypothetical protein APHAL10511_004490 [Amanita phalloides]|nr:hypothetical protein APHAL10511_004490 [Amanita phalloides]